MNPTIQHSAAFLRRRRLYMALPVLTFPFMILLFWLFGGGSGTTMANELRSIGGLNLSLPAAHPKDESRLTKLDYYKRADADSAKRRTQIKNDPYYQLPSLPVFPSDTAPKGLENYKLPFRTKAEATDSNEARVYRRLAALDAQLNRTIRPEERPKKKEPGDVDRMETLLHEIHAKDTSPDPEMDKLEGMLDKIIRIQHPGSEGGGIDKKEGIAKGPVFQVTTRMAEMDTGESGFIYIDDPDPVDSSSHNSIMAVVQENQQLVTGGTICLRLTEDAFISKVHIPRENLVYGRVSLNNDRMMMTISSIAVDQSIYPVSLQAFDLDGLPGIYIPDAMSREVAKQSVTQGIGEMGLTSLDPSIGTQAATAGIQAVKTLLSKKVKQVKVFVKAGYQVLLRNDDRKN